MARQLQRLIDVSRRPKVVIQVVPLDQAVYPGVYGSFRALFNSSPAALDAVEMTHWTGGLYVEEPEQVESYRLLFDEIRSSALSSRQSLDLVSQILAKFEND